ncbi:thioredoxin fold domain-containing protein [Vibrio parahaemolyticus]|nr:thioredoxin fold domain-containing protein [Vibrio parahaemolyticus]
MKTKLLLMVAAFSSLGVSAAEPLEQNELERSLSAAGVKLMDVVKLDELQDLNVDVYVTEHGMLFFDSVKGVMFREAPQLLKDGMSTLLTDRLTKDILKGATGRVVYEAPNEKARIQVFTDFTCEWCQRLHKELPSYAENGVTVEYILYPREGVTGETAKAMTGILNSSDPKLALENAFAGKLDPSYASLVVSEAVADNRRVGGMLGVLGTPGLIIDGVYVDGYIPYQGVIQSAIRAASR